MAKRPPTLTDETLELIWYVRARDSVTPNMKLMAERLFAQLKVLKREEDRERRAKEKHVPVNFSKRKLVLPPPIASVNSFTDEGVRAKGKPRRQRKADDGATTA